MTRRNKRLILIGLAVIALNMYMGCTQPADVLVKVSNTHVFLSEMWNFPSSFDGMKYELWVADTEDTVSLGKFGYNNKRRLFLDELGSIREDSNRFLLKDDFLRFDDVFISVERDPDPDPGSPSNIMLIDGANDPRDDAVDLIFPEINDTLPLWGAIARYAMETVSDDSTYLKNGFIKPILNTRDLASNGMGVWFGNYRRVRDSLRDTIAGRIDSISMFIDTLDKESTFVSVQSVDSIWLDTIPRIFGLDTLGQIVVRFSSTLFRDSTDPETSFVVHWTHETVPPGGVPARPLFYDAFSQDNFRLPNFEPLGWKYKGWVVSEVIDTSFGVLNPPAWGLPYNDSAHNVIRIPGDFGGLITTGTFSDITKPDDANLYTASDRVPPIPGDEFIIGLPDGNDSLNLMPNNFANRGTVFITLEPIVLQGPEYKSNFPLFVLIAPLPFSRSEVTADDQQFTMRNWSQHTTADRGFPKIIVQIERF